MNEKELIEYFEKCISKENFFDEDFSFYQLKKLLHLVKKYKNIAESERKLHYDLKRQRNELSRDKIKLVSKIRRLEEELKNYEK